MNGPHVDSRAGKRRRKKLNQPLIKSLIVFAAAAVTAAGSAVTGIGAHLGFASMLSWMFGYAPEKAQGTALRFSLAGALMAIVIFLILQDHAVVHITRGLMLFIGATVGAIAAAPVTPKPTSTGLLRSLQGIAILVTLFTVTEAAHLSAVTRSDVHYAYWIAWWQILLLGAATGAVTQGARLIGGTLLVPALYFLTAIPDGVHGLRPLLASEAVVEALIVVCFASFLPMLGYAQRKLVDTTYLNAALVGGVIGGACGGWLLTILLERSILWFFGAVAMFFAAREIYRMVGAPVPAVDEGEPEAAADDSTSG